MYNKLLDIFMTVAECKSFTKASEELYLSHTAVLKNINALEKEYEVKLFVRSNRGVRLTQAGKILYQKTLELRKYSEQALREMQHAMLQEKTIIKVATSVFYPCDPFVNLWDSMKEDLQQYRLEIVSIPNDAHRFEDLDTKYDFIIGPYDSQKSGQHLRFYEMGTYHFCIAMPRNHPLAEAKSLCLADLHGETIMMMEPGHSERNDAIRQVIVRQHPQIRILDISPHYSVQTYNECVEKNVLMLSLECWNKVHPAVKTVILEENYTLPYGILTGESTRMEIESFIMKLQSHNETYNKENIRGNMK